MTFPPAWAWVVARGMVFRVLTVCGFIRFLYVLPGP